jgi:hypothetical protein
MGHVPDLLHLLPVAAGALPSALHEAALLQARSSLEQSLHFNVTTISR